MLYPGLEYRLSLHKLYLEAVITIAEGNDFVHEPAKIRAASSLSEYPREQARKHSNLPPRRSISGIEHAEIRPPHPYRETTHRIQGEIVLRLIRCPQQGMSVLDQECPVTSRDVDPPEISPDNGRNAHYIGGEWTAGDGDTLDVTFQRLDRPSVKFRRNRIGRRCSVRSCN